MFPGRHKIQAAGFGDCTVQGYIRREKLITLPYPKLVFRPQCELEQVSTPGAFFSRSLLPPIADPLLAGVPGLLLSIRQHQISSFLFAMVCPTMAFLKGFSRLTSRSERQGL